MTTLKPRKFPPALATLALLLLSLPSCSERGPATREPLTVDSRPTYIVGVDRDFPPYSHVDSQGRIVGFTIDVSRAVAEAMGFSISFRAGTSDEIIVALEDGEIDLIPHLSAYPELERKFAFTLPLLEASDAIFVRDDAAGLFTEAHILDLPTLVWQADAIRETLGRQEIVRQIFDESSIADTLRRLAAGEAACALVPHLTGLELISGLELTNLRIAGPPIQKYTRSLSFAVRSNDGALLERLDRGLALVTNTERYSQLYNTWFGVQDEAIPRQILIKWLIWIMLPFLAMILLAVAWSASLRRTVARRTAALRESEERLGGILDNAPMMIYMKDAQGRYLVVNREFESMVGHRRQQVQDATDSQFFPPPQVAELRAQDKRVIETGEVVACEEIFFTTSGPRTFQSVRFPLHHADGSVSAVCAINADITDRKKAEEEKEKLEAQIQQAQKLESLGVLAGGIAHDFNNLLMGILGNTGLALLELESDSPVRSHLRDVESASKRAADLCKQMLAYSGKGRFVVRPVDITKLVLDMTHLLQVSISKKATLEEDFDIDLPAFEADATQIRQVVMNLITNASEALGDENGTITVRTGKMECDETTFERTYLAEPLAAGVYVFLEVRDTGCGMDATTQEKIFDPFFSTKFAGRGLGLAATLGIVRGHRGALVVESEDGRGTTFRVLFPATGHSVDPPRPQVDEAVDGLADAGMILIVDDEPMVLKIASQVLERASYRVLTASDGEEGLELLRQHHQEIALVLLDMTMPRMDGDEAFHKMRRLNGDLQVLLSSGYNEREATQKLAGTGLAGFIQKPYDPAALLRKVREVMNP